MCGIAGVIGFESLPEGAPSMLKSMEEAIRHRGPDGSGSHVNSKGAFLNLRLAIVDRQGGAQPIYNADRTVGIVYNGEVYNHVEIRDEIEATGVQFQTHTDTEVVLQSFIKDGPKSFERLNGMFAACIWDERTDEIYIVRDQTGIKPLYVYRDKEKLIFASEMKAIIGLPGLDLSLDENGIYDYFTFRYTQAPFSCFSKISRLDAGYYLKIKKGVVSKHAYFERTYTDPKEDSLVLSVEDAKAELKNKLLKAVESQLMGEVPIGVLLSGGVDSSVIAWCIHSLGANLTTYNIGFPEVNEFEFSRAVAEAFNLKHVEVSITPQELLRDFDVTIAHIDEPIADPACFPLYQLCKELKKSVTVVLSGEGGDELFGGYPQYVRLLSAQQQNPYMTPEERFETFLDFSYYFRNPNNLFLNKHIPPHYLRGRKYFVENEGLNSMLAYDMHSWMPDNLMMKADKILMAHSLEGRFPFLDKDLLQFSCNLPTSLKIPADLSTKWLLKSAFDDILPKKITERPKMGFSVPVDSLLKEMKRRVLAAPDKFRDHELSTILDLPAFQELFKNYYDGQSQSALQVWTSFVFFSWFEFATT